MSASRDDLYSLNARIEILSQKFEERELEFEHLKEVIEDNENAKFGFLFTCDEFLKTIDLSLEAPPTIESLGKHSYGSGEHWEERGGTSWKVKELQRTNELLLNELRKANEKYLDERLSSKKIREELENLEMEVEKLKQNNTKLEMASMEIGRPNPI